VLPLLAALTLTAALSARGAEAATVPLHPAPGVYMLSPEYTLDTMVMDVSQAATGPAPVGNYGKHGGPNQQFRIEQYTTTQFGTPVFRLHPMHAPNMCLDIAYASEDVGGKLIQFYCNGQPNQEFFIDHTATGTYTIVPRHSGWLLSVPGSTFTPVQIDQEPNMGDPGPPAPNQRWHLIKVSN
jgi:hypothetical protein